jgi:hypothetical protein
VTIEGTDFNGTSEVKFGEKPAASFKVDNDNQITATSPSSKKPGKVHVTVTTLAGASPNVGADRFNYTACVVPKLTGKHLKAAKKSLKRASCKLGKVKKIAGLRRRWERSSSRARRQARCLLQAPRSA